MHTRVVVTVGSRGVGGGISDTTFSVSTMTTVMGRTLPHLALLVVTASTANTLGAWPQQSAPGTFHQQAGTYNPTCYRNVQNPFVYFGSKTTYGAVAGNLQPTPPDCRPMQVWMVSRHGTRYPSRKTIDKLKKLEEFKKMITSESTMCPEDVAAIRDWKMDLSKDDHYKLQRQGIEELKSLALRLKRQYPQIFNTPYNSTKFRFLTSPKQRAKDSATVFYRSMFNQDPENDLPVIQPSDERLDLYKCKHAEVDDDNDGDKGLDEVKKFVEGPLVRSVVSRVSMAMGLKQNISYENVTLMLESCQYEKAWYIQSRPPWCAVFTTRDFEILEYIDDLKHYYANGYGNPIGETMGCPLVKDLIDSFKDLARDKTGPLGKFYFGHSINVLSVVTRMGIGKDDVPLLSTNFEQMKDRKWRTSFIDPFASNMIAVFYRCQDGNKAMISLNEHAIPMGKDQCRMCQWERIETQFNPITSNKSCNLDVCNNFGTPAVLPSISLIMVLFLACTYNILFKKYI